MRGTYEAFILVKVKDGRKFVCALNRRKPITNNSERVSEKDQQDYLSSRVIWN